MPRSNSSRSLTGGRAAYRSKDAYASQGFENDTRQTQLPAMAALYLWGSQIIPTGASTYTPVNWGSYTSGAFQNVFLRNFFLDGSNQLYCRRGGTYKITTSVATQVPEFCVFNTRLRITRPVNVIRDFYVTMRDTSGTNDVQLTSPPIIVDLLEGDTLVLAVNHDDPGSVTLQGGAAFGTELTMSLTTLYIEQIDLVAPGAG